MAKNPKKKKFSSSSSDEHAGSNLRDDSSTRKAHKRKKDGAFRLSCTKEQKKPDQNDSRRSREIKKPVYRLSTTKEEQKAPGKEERPKERGALQSHEKGCSSTAGTSSEIKTVKREKSKPDEKNCGASINKTTRKKSKDKSSQDRYCELKNQQMRLKLDAAKHRERREGLERKNGSARETSSTSYESSNVKTREASSSHYKHLPNLSSKEWDINTGKNHQYNRSSCTNANPPPATTTVKPDFPARPFASGTNPEKWNSFTPTLENNKLSSSSKQEQTTSIPKQIDTQKFVPFKFRTPKKIQTGSACSSTGNVETVSSKQTLKLKGSLGSFGVVENTFEPATVKPCSLAAPSKSPCKEQNKMPPSPDQLPPEYPPAGDAKREQLFDQGQVVEELHLARSEKRLEVNLLQCYGELTGMDIDVPEEGAAETISRDPKQKTLILVLDTNILLSHLDYVKKIRFNGLEALGFPVVLIPWVVLQELDSLKNRKGLTGSVAHLAAPAISFIYTSLKKRDPHLWGQSMQQATQISNGLNTENNDDRVLQCCLQYQNMYPECALILSTNDKNLSSKAVLSGVKALSKVDLEAGVRRSKCGHNFLQSVQSPVLSHLSHNVSPSPSRTRRSPVWLPTNNAADFSLATPQKDISINTSLLRVGDNKVAEWDLSGYLCELEEGLRDTLSEALETEMKAAYDELWLEIVYIKPPWSLEDVLQCLKKHWFAVFGHVVPRKMSETVAKLINFFSSGETVSTVAFLQETKELVKAFGKSSKLVPEAITMIENILNKLQSQHRASLGHQLSAGDVVMNDDDCTDKQPGLAYASPQEVWSLFENIWSQMSQTSTEVFKALSFDPKTMQAATPIGRPPPPPPQDALACLHRLSSMVLQLLQAFSRVLSSTPALEEVQTLFNIIYANKLVSEDARLTAKDLLDCFSQPDYRERLRFGGNNLLRLQNALDGCVQTTRQNFSFTKQY